MKVCQDWGSLTGERVSALLWFSRAMRASRLQGRAVALSSGSFITWKVSSTRKETHLQHRSIGLHGAVKLFNFMSQNTRNALTGLWEFSH